MIKFESQSGEARIKIKCAFLDRDGAMIYEPENTRQIDKIELLKILPGVIDGLKELVKQGYKLVMVSNQNGIGTPSFPAEDFEKPQNRFLEILKAEGIEFFRVFVCPHFLEDNCACRKPKTGLVDEFLKEFEVDRVESFMYGDRETDRQFAKNIGVRFFKAQTNGPFIRSAFLPG